MIKYYPFELHTHTIHSDGSFTPKELAEHAKKCGLSGFAITDHNTISGHGEALSEGGKPGLTVIRGTEWTTFYGHITVLGKGYETDWRKINPDNVAEYAKRVKSLGGAVGIAHPYRIGYPICTGGSDEWHLKSYRDFTHYEVWSYLSPAEEKTNKKAEEKYIRLTENGERLAAVYGRDWHGEDFGAYAVTFLGIDGGLNEQSALDAIINRRTYISTGVSLDASLVGEKEYPIGSEVEAGNYILKGDAGLFNPDYTERYGVKPGKILLRGTAVDQNIELDFGKLEKAVKLKKGYLQITVTGQIEGKRNCLLFATPFFVN